MGEGNRGSERVKQLLRADERQGASDPSLPLLGDMGTEDGILGSKGTRVEKGRCRALNRPHLIPARSVTTSTAHRTFIFPSAMVSLGREELSISREDSAHPCLQRLIQSQTLLKRPSPRPSPRQVYVTPSLSSTISPSPVCSKAKIPSPSPGVQIPFHPHPAPPQLHLRLGRALRGCRSPVLWPRVPSSKPASERCFPIMGRFNPPVKVLSQSGRAIPAPPVTEVSG